jgi:hypothetical protein
VSLVANRCILAPRFLSQPSFSGLMILGEGGIIFEVPAPGVGPGLTFEAAPADIQCGTQQQQVALLVSYNPCPPSLPVMH